MRWNRKNACLKKIAARVLEQARIALATHNFVIDAARFLAAANLPDKAAVTVPDGTLGSRRGLVNGEKVCAFEGCVRIISENLFDVSGRYLPRNFCIDFNRLNRKRSRQGDRARRRKG